MRDIFFLVESSQNTFFIFINYLATPQNVFASHNLNNIGLEDMVTFIKIEINKTVFK